MKSVVFSCLFSLNVFFLFAQERSFKIFQFPPDKIPVIDGYISDWDIVGDEYTIGIGKGF